MFGGHARGLRDGRTARAGLKALLFFDRPEPFAASHPRLGRILGLDHGKKSVGLALSDPLQIVSTPRGVLSFSKFGSLARTLLHLATKEAVVGFVLGDPLDQRGQIGPRAQSVRDFVRDLHRLTPFGTWACPVLLWDERYTTQALHHAHLEPLAARPGVRPGVRPGRSGSASSSAARRSSRPWTSPPAEDARAAALILQTYLTWLHAWREAQRQGLEGVQQSQPLSP